MYLLDTNACIRILKKTSKSVLKHLELHSTNELHLCSIVKAELLYGARHSDYIEKNLKLLREFFIPFNCFPFDDPCAEEYSKIRENLAKKGLLIGPNDIMIAATAKANNLIVVTHNVKEFCRVEGLQIEDWEDTDLP